MSNSLERKVSSFDSMSSANVSGNDLFYYIHVSGINYESSALKLSDLFLGTNNLNTDILFNNYIDTLVILFIYMFIYNLSLIIIF
jgi:hypothetical protein